MPPLILITNDDGFYAKGIQVLASVARQFGDVVVVAPEHNASGLSHSFTSSRPLRVRQISKDDNVEVYACDGTPVDCTKIALEHFCPRRPNLILSGINHGSNASVNVIYSGTMGAVIEGTTNGFDAIGFSLLSQYHDADFSACIPYIHDIIADVLANGLPADVSLNVNIPYLSADKIKGVKVCQEAKGMWVDSFEKRIDPYGRPYYWMTGKFVCEDENPECDIRLLEQGYVTVVPTTPHYTSYGVIDSLQHRFAKCN